MTTPNHSKDVMKIKDASVFANRDSILQALKEHSFPRVRVYYCGSGDSGGIEEIEVEGMKGNGPEVKFIHSKTTWDRARESWNESIVEESMPLAKAIEQHCYDLIEREHGGWENNDGGSGEFIFDTENGKINWTHNEYYTEQKTSEHEV